MPADLLSDNWTLQSTGELLHRGLQGDITSEVVFSDNQQHFQYQDASADLIRVESLFQILNTIVFADSCVVDADSTSAWGKFETLQLLKREQIIVEKPFGAIRDEWRPLRSQIEDALCFCPEVRKKHVENVRSFMETGIAPDRFLSQLVWGGAGMLARAQHVRMPYAPHPLRQRLIAKADFCLGPQDAARQFRNFVDAQRLKIFERIDSSGYFARMNLPPAVVLILEEATDISDILSVALQFRSQYRPLRKWIAQFQRALDAEEVIKIRSHHKLLRNVADHIERASGSSNADSTIELALWLPRLSIKTKASVTPLLNRFGIRAQINRLINVSPGPKSLKKLTKLLGEEHSKLGLDLQHCFLGQTVQ